MIFVDVVVIAAISDRVLNKNECKDAWMHRIKEKKITSANES